MQEWRKMALLMEIRLQENEKKNVSYDYHVQYAANHLEKAKDVFMKAMKILWIYICLLYTSDAADDVSTV